MTLSVLDIFKIGLGPSSSHTMGPMNAACTFVDDLAASGALERTAKVGAQLYGSLALTGPASLDRLEAWARTYFAAVPDHQRAELRYPADYLPAKAALRRHEKPVSRLDAVPPRL